MARSGVTIAIIQDKTILMTLREDFEVWCLPGGEVDEGESIAEAARRETREETGLDVELTRLVGVYSRLGWLPIHNVVFCARITGGTLQPDPHEVLEARFFPFDALPEHLLIGQGYKIQDAINGIGGKVVSEYVTEPEGGWLSRAEMYRLRDQSGLSRREFYQRTIPELRPEQIKVEVAGIEDQGA